MTSADALNIILGTIAVPLASVLAAALLKLRAKLGKEDTAQDKENLETEIQSAIGAGMAVVAARIPSILKDGITTSELLEMVASASAVYFRNRYPDRTAQIAAAADKGDRVTDVHDAVQQTIASRLTNGKATGPAVTGPGAGLGAVATSPATTLPAMSG